MSSPTSRRRTFGYGPVVMTSSFFACILMNAITMSYQWNEFRSWTSLSSPPSEVKRIIEASDSQIWVETQDGQFFTADISFYCRDSEMCWDWEATPRRSIPTQEFAVLRGKDCETLRESAWSPSPKAGIVECVYARTPGLLFGDEGYFALTDHGNVYYWRNTGNILDAPIFFIFSTLIFPWLVAAIITALYLGLAILARLRKTR